MKNKMKYSSSTIIFLLVLFFNQSFSQITSTSTGGEWKSPTTWQGGSVPTKDQDVVIAGPVYITNGVYSSTTGYCKNLTINSGASITGDAWLEIHGNLINNGSLENYITSIYGNLQNNGTITGGNITFLGTNQTIGATKKFENKSIIFNCSDLLVKATSDLEFHNTEVYSLSYSKTTFDLGKYGLSFFSDSLQYSGYYDKFIPISQLRSIDIKFDGDGIIYLNKAGIGNVVFEGNVNLKGELGLFTYNSAGRAIFNGNLEIDKSLIITAEDTFDGFIVNGDFINYGEIATQSSKFNGEEIEHNSLNINVSGNVMNYGNIKDGYLNIFADDKERSIVGEFDCQISVKYNDNDIKNTGKIIIPGTLTATWENGSHIKVYCPLEIKPEGKIETNGIYTPIHVYNNQSSSWGEVINNGTVTALHSVNKYPTFENRVGTFSKIYFADVEDGFDSIKVTCFNNQTHPSIEGCIKRWWRIESLNDKKVNNVFYTLNYDDETLNGQDENNLQLYNSQDGGETWELISFSENITRDTENNTITFGSSDDSKKVNCIGDFILSSGAGSNTVESEIKTYIVGRENLRVGAPNNFTFHYENVSEEESGDFLLAIALAEDTRLDEVTLYRNGEPEVFTPDQIWTGMEDDSLTIVFYVPYMSPWETSKIDLKITGIPNSNGNFNTKMSKIASPDELLTIAAGLAVSYVIGAGVNYVVGKTTGYMADKFVENVGLTETEQNTYARGMGLTAQQTRLKKYNDGQKEFWIKHTADFAIDNAAKLTPGAGFAKGLGDAIAENVAKKVAPSLRQRIWYWLYKETGLYDDEKVGDKSYKAKVSGGSNKNGERVTSWDPNEKIGPSGFGVKNHLANLSKMDYRILFENKKEATAPAYRVVIRDTLSNVFDPETVEFGSTSHNGDQYNWKITRDGNVLTWDIEGIELPPNVTSPEGEGWVSFSVSPKTDLPSGTEIKNKATIIFDMNEPIVTNEVINILDFDKPTTEMKLLPAISETEKITVEWNCDDKTNGSGVESTTLFMSVNEAPFAELLTTSEKYATVDVFNGNDYKFYAISKDNVGNKETEIPEFVTTSILTSITENETPDKFELKQNYPNPFNPETRINFSLPEQSNVEITIYNVLGQEVEEITNAIYPAGKHFAIWNAEKFASGVYVYKLKSTSMDGKISFSDAKKMLLLK